MSGIEKMHLLVLAVDRICKHYDYFKWDVLEERAVGEAVQQLKNALRGNKRWKRQVHEATEGWVDLREMVADDILERTECFDGENCVICSNRGEREVKFSKKGRSVFCFRCWKTLKRSLERGWNQIFERNFMKFVTSYKKEIQK